LKSLGVIARGPRAPEPGAPIAWVTTQRFFEVFALGSLRHLPDLDTLEDAGALGRDVDDGVEAALDDGLGIMEEEDDAGDETEVGA
jgi:segregation and condensation protein B